MVPVHLLLEQEVLLHQLLYRVRPQLVSCNRMTMVVLNLHPRKKTVENQRRTRLVRQISRRKEAKNKQAIKMTDLK